ncbi:MAG: amino acid adenylation domain-containing protein [Phycisphaerales bacterium]|nr:amino acid adenylation domain-containing protein [Phycisphaerales bacterium]
MNDFSGRIANLPADKRALLETLLTEKRSAAVIPRLPRSGQTQAFPASFAQQRLWLLDQWQPNSPVYNVGMAYRLEGALDIVLLERCAQEIVARHESLRTSFSIEDEEPVQVIHPSVKLSLALTDLSGLPEDQRAASKLAFEEVQAPFDLTRAPLLRIKVLCLNEDEHVLLLTMHHIVSDGWSMALVCRELEQLYRAHRTGLASPLPELPIQYADYAIWQRQRLQGKDLDIQTAYWKKQLADAPALLELPTDRARPAVQSFNGARQIRIVPKRVSDALKTLSQREGATLFMALLATFQVLLSRYSRASDIAVGSPIAGRVRAETENLIGFFVNTLVLRTDLSGNPSFRELLHRVREVALGAYTHQDLPFEKLVEELNPERSLSYSPLFQVMFALQNMGPRELHLPGTTVLELEIERLSTKFDLSVTAFETGEGLRLNAYYSAELFDAETITRLLGHYEALLEGVIADPNRCIADLPLIGEEERKLVLIDWNDNWRDYPGDKCVHELFEARVVKTPDAIALVFKDEEVTYAELNAKANRLGHHLIVLGVGPEVLVGICAERSIEMIVALIAILKAGGAYLPFDPAYPKERLAFMLEDARIAVLVTSSKLAEDLPETSARLALLDEEQDSGYPESNRKPNVGPDNLAYVIYTSGSTGQPKGVMITHRSIAAHVQVMQGHYELSESDRVLQFASLNFDVSLDQILTPLISGASLVVRGTEIWSPGDFCEQALNFGLTVAKLPTAYWQQLVDEWTRDPGLACSGRLRLVTAGGGAMQVESLRRWQQTPLRNIRLLNCYGPTEATITATFFEVPRDRSKFLFRVPIGRPVANAEVYILDPHLAPVPIGVPGELHIGGDRVARGYLNHPDLTAERFVPNPFSKNPDARLYKTGDLARYLADGNIEFLGRTDQQVKIRGFRIELGEIETVLMQHRAVGEAVVIAREDARGDKRLVAYVVNREDASPSELSSFLKDKLPEYMLPSAIVVLDRLPISPNGKVDRRALPAPEYRFRRGFRRAAHPQRSHARRDLR